jgi:hypothetical protein
MSKPPASTSRASYIVYADVQHYDLTTPITSLLIAVLANRRNARRNSRTARRVNRIEGVVVCDLTSKQHQATHAQTQMHRASCCNIATSCRPTIQTWTSPMIMVLSSQQVFVWIDSTPLSTCKFQEPEGASEKHNEHKQHLHPQYTDQDGCIGYRRCTANGLD